MPSKRNKEAEEIAVNAQPLSSTTDVLLDNASSPLAPKESNYSMIRQDTTTNALARISSKSNIIKKDFSTTGIIQTKNGKTDLKFIIKEYANITLKNSTSKLLRALQIKLTETGNRIIKIPLKEYMEKTGLSDEKEARKSINADLKTLYNISCEATSPYGKKEHIEFRILDMKGEIKNSVIIAGFSNAIYEHLMSCPVMPYANDLLKIPNKYTYAYYLGDKINELMKYNQIDRTTKDVKPYFIASVKNLLKVCFDNGMPTYEKVQSTDRAIDRRIITPFENNMDACNCIFEWEYCNEKGIVLSDTQLSDRTYKNFEARYVKITFKHYPVLEYDVKKSKQSAKNKAKKNTSKAS